MPFDANDPDTKAAIKAITDKLSGDFEARLEQLEAKKDEALTEAKKAKAELRKTQEIKPEDVAALETERDRLAGELTAAQKLAKDAAAAAEKATKALETEQIFTHRLVAENGLVKSLSDNGVSDPAYLEAAKAMHIGAVKVVADGDVRKALYGDKDLATAIKEWAAGDVGKKFVAAPNNSGGGAPGGGGAQGGKTMPRTQFDALDPAARMAAVKDGTKIVDVAA